MAKERVGGKVTYISKGESATTRAFRNMPVQEQITKLKAIQKQLSAARAAETRAYKAYQLASGHERVSPTFEAKQERRAGTTAAHEKYVQAQEKREEIEAEYNSYLNAYNSRQTRLF